VTVGLHPGGSAACGRPLLAMYWMVAGCGGQDESRRERHTIGTVAVHGGARNAQHLRDVIASETGGGRERNPPENTSRKQATVVSEMWSLGPTTTRSHAGRPGHPTCRTRCRRGWPPPGHRGGFARSSTPRRSRAGFADQGRLGGGHGP
jgi:hypothetical protein